LDGKVEAGVVIRVGSHGELRRGIPGMICCWLRCVLVCRLNDETD
jgi:hypothetical protein